MISVDNGKMILMSSHRSTQNNANFIDIATLRSGHILSNHVNYVCPVHLKEMLSIQKNVNVCLCNIFNQPFHIDTSGSFKALTELLSTRNKTNDGGGDYSMLCELGVDLNSIEENEELQTLSNNSLCTKKALILLQTNLVHISNLINPNKMGTNVSCTVMVYIDPAPIPGDKSYNAICFTTRVEYNNLSNNVRSHKYVLLAIEKFSSDLVDKETRDYGIATAKLLMEDIQNIFLFHNGYFKKFIIAPEADSISMDRFLLECKNLYNKFENNHPQIYFTMIREPMNKAGQIKATANYNKQRASRGLPALQNKTGNKRRKIDADILCKDDQYSSSLTSTKLRIGYNLGREKRRIYMEFLMNELNAHNVCCATEIFSISLVNENISIPTFVANNLSALRRKPSGEITGKGFKNGEYQADDVAVAVIMSTMLFPHTLDKQFNNPPLYELQKTTAGYENELLKGAEHTVTMIDQWR